MKTNLFQYFALFFIVCSFIGNTVTISAQQQFVSSTNTKSFVLENGDSISIRLITETPTKIAAYSNTHTISGKKELLYKNASGELLWSFVLSASFSYTGNSSTCTSVDTSSSIISSAWKISDISKSKTNNTATGTVTTHESIFGINVKTVTETLTLTCSKNGELS